MLGKGIVNEAFGDLRQMRFFVFVQKAGKFYLIVLFAVIGFETDFLRVSRSKSAISISTSFKFGCNSLIQLIIAHHYSIVCTCQNTSEGDKQTQEPLWEGVREAGQRRFDPARSSGKEKNAFRSDDALPITRKI
jgi:hypothetical protein